MIQWRYRRGILKAGVEVMTTKVCKETMALSEITLGGFRPGGWAQDNN